MLVQEEAKIKQLLTKYQNPDVTFRDIIAALKEYHGLACKQETYVFSNRFQMMLVNLQGVIPVTYMGVIYNFPVCIWLMDTHPNNAPVCFVKPTPDMSIKMSCYVDQNGKIYLPYLHDWSPASSDLLGLIQVMICIFGEHPPVYSKPKYETAVPYPTQPFMPMPGTSGGGTPYPPYPPRPGYPPQMGYPPASTAYPPAGGGPPYPTGGGGQAYQPPPTQQPQQHRYPPYPTQPQPQTANASAAAGTGTITEEHIRASLLSAVEDKLRRRLDEHFSQIKAELDILQQTANELVQGKGKLEKLIERQEKEKNELERNITVLKEKEKDLEKAISRLSDKEDIDVDEAVTTTAPLYKQILNAYAEEAATEDTIYYMSEALRRGVIDLDVFLKQVRSLSRKQFMLRALMQKCRQKAGLAG
ncbi:tumor susceptibility gene 101 protein isoform X1 [Nilaparvata lugens]|uniref:tumor susceptibility gene 101 protein isoform X1 n=1 Tax=Nilaparvata lugens TaxID=108931 RepID=UPI00193D7236|nr:tumor susceptibility gene 101 protein isoform X1 [Nilaparvata lugens]